MSLHTAKGLEFKLVYLTGLEEGLFPHSRSVGDRAALEEERRLCYVGLTRARERLFLSAARARAVFGSPRLSELSRFVGEIPAELLDVAQAGFLPSIWSDTAARPRLTTEGSTSSRNPTTTTGPWPLRRARRGPRRAVPPPFPPPPHLGSGGFAPGARVFHASFGEGFVIDADGEGPRQKLTIDFPHVGRKVIVARFVDPS